MSKGYLKKKKKSIKKKNLIQAPNSLKNPQIKTNEDKLYIRNTQI